MGDAEEVEDLALEVVEAGLEDLHELTVLAGQVVAGGVGEHVKDAWRCGRFGGAGVPTPPLGVSGDKH